MSQLIGVSKAARMIGVSRSDLSKRLASAGVETFEGQVDLEKVKCLAPTLNLSDPDMDRLDLIRENPVERVRRSDTTSSTQDLLDEIHRLSTELMVEAGISHQYRQLIEDVASKLGEMQVSEVGERRDIAFELCEWLRHKASTD
ncbi:MAG TPA: hypothetical protein ENI69_08775 [Rhodospirillales bacterium]|nr:hypothetical protein [Rhodospirillales bacterium]